MQSIRLHVVGGEAGEGGFLVGLGWGVVVAVI